ncbi:MAG: HAD-IIA family hydrolase [Actinomycetes bacterium]
MTTADPGTLLVDRFDALLFDLDGVVYVGPSAVPHAAASIASAQERGVSCVYVTNNAARSPQTVADHLTELGVPAGVADVVTSPQAAVSLLTAYVPAGSRVLVIGGAGISEALLERGFVPVTSLEDSPAAVMQGYSPDLTWRDLAEATFAVREGLPWIATNPDMTFPTPRGVAPGNGSLVDVVARTVGRGPDAVAGKPEPALLREAISRVGSQRPLMVGDRLDTDISAGSRVDVPTLLVFTGVSTMAELLGAVAHERPHYVAYDLRGLLEPYPDVVIGDAVAECGVARALVTGTELDVTWPDGTDPWDAVRAATALAWRCADAGQVLDLAPAAGRLTAATLGPR